MRAGDGRVCQQDLLMRRVLGAKSRPVLCVPFHLQRANLAIRNIPVIRLRADHRLEGDHTLERNDFLRMQDPI
jgi:hypothetical protein